MAKYVVTRKDEDPRNRLYGVSGDPVDAFLWAGLPWGGLKLWRGSGWETEWEEVNFSQAIGKHALGVLAFLLSVKEEAAASSFPHWPAGLSEPCWHLAYFDVRAKRRFALTSLAARAYALAYRGKAAGRHVRRDTALEEECIFAGLSAGENIISLFLTGEEAPHWRDRQRSPADI